MKRVYKKVLIYLSPFIIWFGIIIIIDAYNYFNIFEFFPLKEKEKISYPINTVLWKMIQFKNNPSENILLGDSRMDHMNIEKINEITGEKYFNFGFGGASILEICKAFWFAQKVQHSKKVFIGLNFNQYSIRANREIFSNLIHLFDFPILYFFNYNVLESSFYILKNKYLNENINIGKPDMNKDDFWNYQLNVTAKEAYSGYQYPIPYFYDLLRIKKYCIDNNIQLSIIVFPTSSELHEIEKKSRLIGNKERFRTDLIKIGKTYYFDFDNSTTKNRELFTDPFHYGPTLGDTIIQYVWGKRTK